MPRKRWKEFTERLIRCVVYVYLWDIFSCSPHKHSMTWESRMKCFSVGVPRLNVPIAHNSLPFIRILFSLARGIAYLGTIILDITLWGYSYSWNSFNVIWLGLFVGLDIVRLPRLGLSKTALLSRRLNLWDCKFQVVIINQRYFFFVISIV